MSAAEKSTSARVTLLAWTVAAQLETASPPIPIAGPVEAYAESEQTRITLTLRPRDWEPPAADESDSRSMCRDFMFSPLELQVVRYLAEHGATKGSALGRHTANSEPSGQASAKLRTLLANLVERNILASEDNGYRLADGFLPLARALGLFDDGQANK